MNRRPCFPPLSQWLDIQGSGRALNRETDRLVRNAITRAPVESLRPGRSMEMRREAVITIVNACIWGFVLIMTSYALRGTDAYEKIQLILGGGAAASLLVVGTGIVRKSKQ